MACEMCYKLKKKCDGGIPCFSCKKKGCKCVKHEPKKRRGTKKHEPKKGRGTKKHVVILDEEDMIAYVAKHWNPDIVADVFN